MPSLMPGQPAELATTQIGSLFLRYERLTTKAHMEDGKLAAEDAPSAKKLRYVRELWNDADAAREQFLRELSAIYEKRMEPDSSYWADGVLDVVKAAFTPQ